MATTTINPGDSAVFDTREGGTRLRLTNQHDEDAKYTIEINGGNPEEYELEPGEIKDYNFTDRQTTAEVDNIGDVSIQADFT